MENKPKNIGELYQKSLKDLDLKEDFSEWPALEIKIEKVKFFRFGWSYFNIYYSLLITLAFLFSSTLMVDHFLLAHNQTGEITKTEKQPGLLKENLTNREEKDFSAPKTIPAQKFEKSNKETEKPKKEIIYKEKPNTDTTDKKKENPNGSMTTTIDTTTLINHKKPKDDLKKPPVVYIIKRDTLLIIDSVKTNKGKKR